MSSCRLEPKQTKEGKVQRRPRVLMFGDMKMRMLLPAELQETSCVSAYHLATSPTQQLPEFTAQPLNLTSGFHFAAVWNSPSPTPIM